MMASTMMSQPLRSSSFVVPERLPSVRSLSCGVTLPLSTPPVRNLSIRDKPFLRRESSTSRTIVLYPAAADTCAIPAPMRPQPRTPTVLICILLHRLHYRGDSLTAADARRCEPALQSASSEFQR